MAYSNPAAEYAAHETILRMMLKGLPLADAPILVLGLEQPADIPELSHREVVSFARALEHFGPQVEVYDPTIDPIEVGRETGLKCLTQPPQEGVYSAIVLTAAQHRLPDLGSEGLRALCQPDAVLYDLYLALFSHHADAAS
ncbi:MAG: hypothetical protein U1C47_19225 [Hydrogenophaga sp.]|nr:hypothetical protein [Hydrogenophaga sp.]